MRQITAVVVDPSGDVQVREIEDDFKTYQSLVGGYIEGVFGDGYTMYLNEEGAITGLPLNKKASGFVGHRSALGKGVSLFGTVVILGPSDSEGNDTNVQQDIIDHFKEN